MNPYTSPLSLVAYAITAFLAYWAWHDDRYKKGLVKHPFFSRGGQRKQPRRSAQMRYASNQEVDRAVLDAVRQVTAYTHNQEVATRLLGSTMQRNRHRPIEWCVEKTIDDLIRDRR